MRTTAMLILLACACLPSAASQTAVVEADRDATLIEHPTGDLANGAGPYLFTGRTSQARNGIRRGLLVFDVASALPRRAIVERVRLILSVETSNDVPRDIRLHRVLADWSEGLSSTSGGGGAAAEPGDATWLHTAWDDAFWVRPGGQFLGRVSATTPVGASGEYVWVGGMHLIQDVRLWLANPRRNHGWIVIGDESTPQTAKAIVSREHAEPDLRPRLEVSYRLPGLPMTRSHRGATEPAR